CIRFRGSSGSRFGRRRRRSDRATGGLPWRDLLRRKDPNVLIRCGGTGFPFGRFRRSHGGRSGGGDSSGGSAAGGSRDRGSRGVRRSHAATRTAATPAAANPRTRRAVAHGNSPPVGGGGGVTATTCIRNVFTLSSTYVSAGVTLPTTIRNVWFPTPTAMNDGAYTTADAPGASGP